MGSLEVDSNNKSALSNTASDAAASTSQQSTFHRELEAFNRELARHELSVQRGIAGANLAAAAYQKTVEEGKAVTERASSRWSILAPVAGYRAVKDLITGDFAKPRLVPAAEQALAGEQDLLKRLGENSELLSRVRSRFEEAKKLSTEGKRSEAEQILSELRKENVFAAITGSFQEHERASSAASAEFTRTSTWFENTIATAEIIRDSSAMTAALIAAPASGTLAAVAASVSVGGTVHAASELSHVAHGLRSSSEAAGNMLNHLRDSAITGVTTALGMKTASAVGRSVTAQLGVGASSRLLAGSAGSLAFSQIQTASGLIQGQEFSNSEYAVDLAVGALAGGLGGYSGAVREQLRTGLRQAMVYAAEFSGDLTIGMTGAHAKASAASRAVTYRDILQEVHSSIVGSAVGEISSAEQSSKLQTRVRSSQLNSPRSGMLQEGAPGAAFPAPSAHSTANPAVKNGDQRTRPPMERTLLRETEFESSTDRFLATGKVDPTFHRKTEELESAIATLKLSNIESAFHAREAIDPALHVASIQEVHHALREAIEHEKNLFGGKERIYAAFTEAEIIKHSALLKEIGGQKLIDDLILDLIRLHDFNANGARVNQLARHLSPEALAQIVDSSRHIKPDIELGRVNDDVLFLLGILDLETLPLRSIDQGLYIAHRTENHSARDFLELFVPPEVSVEIQRMATRMNAEQGLLQLPTGGDFSDEAAIFIRRAEPRASNPIRSLSHAVARSDWVIANLMAEGWEVFPNREIDSSLKTNLRRVTHQTNEPSPAASIELEQVLAVLPVYPLQVRDSDVNSAAASLMGELTPLLDKLSENGTTSWFDSSLTAQSAVGIYQTFDNRIYLDPTIKNPQIFSHEAQHAFSEQILRRFKSPAVEARHGEQGQQEYFSRFGEYSEWAAVRNIVRGLEALPSAQANTRRQLIASRNPELAKIIHYAEMRLDPVGIMESIAVDAELETAKARRRGGQISPIDYAYMLSHQARSYARVGHLEGFDPGLTHRLVVALAGATGNVLDIDSIKDNVKIFERAGIHTLTESERIARVETIEASKHAERYLNAFHLGHASRALVPYDLAIGHVSGKTDATSIQLYHVLRERRALSILLQADLQAINNPDIQNDALNNLIVEAHEELFESASHLGELSLTNRIFSSANPGANDILERTNVHQDASHLLTMRVGRIPPTNAQRASQTARYDSTRASAEIGNPENHLPDRLSAERLAHETNTFGRATRNDYRVLNSLQNILSEQKSGRLFDPLPSEVISSLKHLEMRLTSRIGATDLKAPEAYVHDLMMKALRDADAGKMSYADVAHQYDSLRIDRTQLPLNRGVERRVPDMHRLAEELGMAPEATVEAVGALVRLGALPDPARSKLHNDQRFRRETAERIKNRLVPPKGWLTRSELLATANVSEAELGHYLREVLPNLVDKERSQLARRYPAPGESPGGLSHTYVSPQIVDRIISTRGMSFPPDGWMMTNYARYFATRGNERAQDVFAAKLESLMSQHPERPQQFIGADGWPATYLPPSWLIELRNELADQNLTPTIQNRSAVSLRNLRLPQGRRTDQAS